MNLRIEGLTQHRTLIPTIERQFREAWPDHYGPGGPGDAQADIVSLCRQGGLPLGLVALEEGQFCGIVALRTQSVSHHHLSPWVTSFYVPPALRRQGIGRRLLAAVAHRAAAMGFKRIYASTRHAASLFRRAGWVPFDTIGTGTQRLFLFLQALDPP